jgi:phosphatidyl-myo-inositol dimannoside synthase
VATLNKYSNKRVLLVLPEAFARAGGIQMFCRALCLATSKWAQNNSISVTALVLNDGNVPDERYVNGGFAHYIGARRSKIKFVGHFLSKIISYKYDWLILGHVSLSPLALLAKLFTPKIKTGIVAYGIEVWRPLSTIQRQALRQVDVFLSISDYTKAELIKNSAVLPEKIRILPCALDPHWQLSPQIKKRESTPPVVLSVTRLTKEDRYKGIDNVIRCLPAIVRIAGPIDYRIVGEGDDVPRLRALAAGLGVGRYITFMGRLDDTELREQYRRCSLFVLPSREEGFGIVFLEAMAYGKPVVGGAHGGTPSVVKDGETGLLVDSADVTGIAQSITRLLGDAELRERFGRAGHQRLLDEFTFERFERNLHEVFQSLS